MGIINTQIQIKVAVNNLHFLIVAYFYNQLNDCTKNVKKNMLTKLKSNQEVNFQSFELYILIILQKLSQQFITTALKKNMYTYPFLNMMVMGDPFDHSLANSYDPTCPFNPNQFIEYIQSVPKVEEGTSPDYALPNVLQQELKTEKLVKQKNRKNKKRNDDEYTPYERENVSKGMVKHKEDRNLIPNTVHHLLAFVQKQFKSSYLVQKIFKRINKNSRYTITRYYNYHKMLRAKVNTYVNEQAMKIITEFGSLDYTQYDEREQAFYCSVSRILIRKFLRLEAVLLILNSKKVRKENISDHLRVQRYLYENMLAMDSL